MRLPSACYVIFTLVVALLAGPAFAQVIQLECAHNDSGGGWIATIDYGGKTLMIDPYDAGGNVSTRVDYLQRMPATISTETIVAVARFSNGWSRITINRHTGILGTQEASGETSFTHPCTRRQVSPRRF